MPVRRKSLLIGGGTLAIFALAWLAGRQTAISSSNITRLYDVRELLIDVPNFDDAPNMGLDPDARKRRPPAPATGSTRDQKLDDLIRVIRSTIDPDSWHQPGRALARLTHHVAATNSPQTHQKIAEFLRDLRAARSTVIQVEARMMSIDTAAIERLPAALRDRIAANDTAPLSQAQADAIVADLTRAGAKTITAPRVSVFSGQRAYILSANQRAYVASLTHVIKNGVTTFEPNVDVVDAGHLLDLHATASADRKHVTFTLRTQFAQLLEIQNVEQQKIPPDGSAVVQRPIVNLHALRSTVTVPAGQTLLLWSFDHQQTPTFPSTQPATRPATEERLLLLIKPTISSSQSGDTQPKTLPSGP
jgi:hypothetical protein